MRSTTAAVIFAFTSAAIASPANFRRADCETAFDACRTAPDANQSYCASQHAQCLAGSSASATATAAVSSITASSTSASTASSGLPLGAICDYTIKNQCANGVDCYAVTSESITRCGNFQATCSTDSQCGYNTCNEGFCNGFLASSAYLVNAATSTAASVAAPSTTASSTTASTTSSGLPLGATCDHTIKNQCANGVNCYAVNSGLINRCGNFQATCSTDSQCAYNTCNQGLCNGFLASSAYLVNAATSTAASVAAPSTTASSTTASTTSSGLPLGATCDHTIKNQCANGVNCYAVTSESITRCGNFQATCSTDSQCAYNTCNQGLCNGFLASSAYLVNAATSTAASVAAPSDTVAEAAVPTSSTVAVAAAKTGEATDLPGWTVQNLIRYCGADGTGCDYNFGVDNGSGSQENCTISTFDSSIYESFYNHNCSDDSVYSISWGYSDQFGAEHAFAVLTVVDTESNNRAFFGVSEVNSQAVSASSPKGSGHFGNIGPQTVYVN